MLRAKAPRKIKNRRSATSRAEGGGSSRFASVDWGRFRLHLVAGMFGVLWVLLWARVWYVQMIDGPFLADRARRQHMAAEMVSGGRGSIVDRNGQVLARSVRCRSVSVNPREVHNIEATAATLAQILDMPVKHVLADLNDKRGYVWLARKIDDRRAAAIQKANLPGVKLEAEFDRIYPFKQMAGQLLGFVGMDDKGLEGIERALDDDLSGLALRKVVQRDASGRRYFMPGESPEDLRGRDVKLTLDVQVQFFAEQALSEAVDQNGAKWGGCLVVDVESGDVLAWAQYPFFNPNSYRDYKPGHWRNRMASDALEPGSTLKPFLVAAALQEGKVKRDTLFNCEKGKWATRYTTIRDTHPYDMLPVNKILRVSSNIGCAKIGLELGARKYHDYLTRLGFGGRTGVPVAESRGILRAPKDWSESDVMATAFGQSISVTGLQMAQAYLTLINHGIHKPLRLIVDDETPTVAQAPQRIFDEKATRQVMSMLEEVVHEEGGTGAKAQIPGVSVGGKTGTAQKADSSGSYGRGRLASFVGIVPMNAPKYLVVVMVDEPTRSPYGGIVAAPVFREVAMRTMAYHGMLPDPTAVALQEMDKAKAKNKTAKGKKPLPATAAKPLDEVRNELSAKVSDKVVTVSTDVPDVVGKSVRRAVEMFAIRGMVPVLKGEGQTVVRQSPEPGAALPDGKKQQECILWLSEHS